MNKEVTLENLLFVFLLVPFTILLACAALYVWAMVKLEGRKDQINMNEFQ